VGKRLPWERHGTRNKAEPLKKLAIEGEFAWH
jgi:hypothetical protein